jgi:hypothetical protein
MAKPLYLLSIEVQRKESMHHVFEKHTLGRYLRFYKIKQESGIYLFIDQNHLILIGLCLEICRNNVIIKLQVLYS